MNKREINKKYIVFIPVRKNSKRIKNKNFVKIKNKPLLYYTYREAIKIFNNKNIYVSSNDTKAKNFSKKFNLQFVKRPDNLSTDKSKTEHAILHFMNNYKEIPENIILLQTTSPMRKSRDILACIKKFENKKLDSIFSVYKEKNFLWKKNKKKLVSFSFNYKHRLRSQDLDDIYHENGSIFIFKVKKFLKYKNRIFGKFDFFEMSKSNSSDLDTKEDLKILKRYLK